MCDVVRCFRVYSSGITVSVRFLSLQRRVLCLFHFFFLSTWALVANKKLYDFGCPLIVSVHVALFAYR